MFSGEQPVGYFSLKLNTAKLVTGLMLFVFTHEQFCCKFVCHQNIYSKSRFKTLSVYNFTKIPIYHIIMLPYPHHNAMQFFPPSTKNLRKNYVYFYDNVR